MEAYTGNDIYCDRIIPRTVPIEIVAETDNVLAYRHTNPHWETHIMVVPKQHVLSIIELAEQPGDIVRELLEMVASVARQGKANEGGCTIFTTTGDNQRSKHLHIHA